jgi:hypothetical protein
MIPPIEIIATCRDLKPRPSAGAAASTAVSRAATLDYRQKIAAVRCTTQNAATEPIP